ncbi:MAG: MBL fold metallo-hydrolase [Gammaproteobacteria bacterium]|nr:MBL fold metallo-hydrolase [Gammaproteobacteria bacterium]
MENFVYLVIDNATRRAAVVDPAWEVERIVAAARMHDVQITDVLLTHSHHDHINGIDELRAQYDAQLHLLKPEAEFWGGALGRPTLHHGGAMIDVGETSIKVLHTPGHTPGSACYHVGNNLISGDTVFVWGCGRCDFKGGDPELMFTTLRRIAQELPGDTIILPGHNYSDKTTATVQEQIDGNPFFCFEQKADFVRYRMFEHDKSRHSPYEAVACKHHR